MFQIGERSVCQLIQERYTYVDVDPVYQTYPVNVGSPTPNLLNTVLTVGAANGVLTDVLTEARNIWPYPQTIIPPATQQVPITSTTNIPVTLYPNQPNIISTIPQPVQTIEINSGAPCRTIPTPFVVQSPVSIIQSPVQTINSVSPCTTSSPILLPAPIPVRPTPIPSIVPSEFVPSISYSPVRSPLILPTPAPCAASPVPTVVATGINTAISSPVSYAAPTSVLSSGISPLISYNTISQPSFPTPVLTVPSPVTRIVATEVNPTPCGSIQTPLVLPGPTALYSQISTIDVNPYTPYYDDYDYDTDVVILVEQSLPNPYSLLDTNVVTAIEIDTDINTVVSNLDLIDYYSPVSYLQNDVDRFVPYTLEINIPVLTNEVVVPNSGYLYPDYGILPQIPLAPPPQPPIIIQKCNSNTNGLNTLLLGLLLTRN